jgi:hypothetical protein
VTDASTEEPHGHPPEQPTNGTHERPAGEPFWDFKASHWATAILTAIIAIVGFLQFSVYTRQAKIMEVQTKIASRQVELMQTDTRPWVYADLRSGGAIYRNQSGGLTIPIIFTLHNTGHLPALYVSPDIEGYLDGTDGKVGSQTARERQQKRCNSPLQQPAASDQIGVAVFPGQVVPFGINIGITETEIDNVKRFVLDKTGKEDSFLGPWGTGCIRYRSPNGEFHQTGAAFTILMIKPGQAGQFALPIDPTGIDPRNIMIAPFIVGGTAYAN